jgi:hypothetical protein
MKTFLIDLDGISPEVFKEIIGFILTAGLNFRKLDQRIESRTGRTLFVEVETRAEEKALKEFLTGQAVLSPIIIKNENKAVLDGKIIGTFCQTNRGENCYVDNLTGKKFTIVR